MKPLGDRNLKGVGSIDLYVVTLEEGPTAPSVSKAGKRRSGPSEEKKKSARSLSCRSQISARNATRNTSVMVSQKKSSTPSVRSAVSTFRPEHPASHFAESAWMRARSGSVLALRRFLTAASEKLESASASASNSLTRAMGTSSGRNALIERLKISSQSRTKSPEAFWNR